MDLSACNSWVRSQSRSSSSCSSASLVCRCLDGHEERSVSGRLPQFRWCRRWLEAGSAEKLLSQDLSLRGSLLRSAYLEAHLFSDESVDHRVLSGDLALHLEIKKHVRKRGHDHQQSAGLRIRMPKIHDESRCDWGVTCPSGMLTLLRL